MSIQQVFESARRLGLPVIVTDLGARDPMVVLPLEQFEALASESPIKTSMKTESHDGLGGAGASSNKQIGDQDSFSGSAAGQDIPLDERFYLEPVDETK
ncbi:MAG: hypothetical protein ABIB04_04745 [Patescibacteria group bacterium]